MSLCRVTTGEIWTGWIYLPLLHLYPFYSREPFYQINKFYFYYYSKGIIKSIQTLVFKRTVYTYMYRWGRYAIQDTAPTYMCSSWREQIYAQVICKYVFKHHTVCEWYQYLIDNLFHCCNFMTSHPFLKVLTRCVLNLTDTGVSTMISYFNNLSSFVWVWFCDLALVFCLCFT